VAEAQGGTLFLAHVEDAPARVQSRLARVLRDGEMVVGDSRRATPVVIRPIASTDASWDAAVAEGRIRVDLARRVSETRVEVPALRNRREDIPQLAACLVHAACASHRMPPKTIDPPAVSLLTALPWRGNVRELRALLEALVMQVPGAIRLEDLLAAVSLDGAARTLPTGTLREARARFERDYITAVLEHHRGRIGEAARALGIQRTNLYRKMRSLNVAWRPAGGNGTGVPGPRRPGGTSL
jgi:DNA-binding NtrC family response regulator